MAVIHFDKEHRIDVVQSASEIQRAVMGQGQAPAPVISLTKTGTEEPILVVASQIRTISEPGRAEPLVDFA